MILYTIYIFIKSIHKTGLYLNFVPALQLYSAPVDIVKKIVTNWG